MEKKEDPRKQNEGGRLSHLKKKRERSPGHDVGYCFGWEEEETDSPRAKTKDRRPIRAKFETRGYVRTSVKNGALERGSGAKRDRRKKISAVVKRKGCIKRASRKRENREGSEDEVRSWVKKSGWNSQKRPKG